MINNIKVLTLLNRDGFGWISTITIFMCKPVDLWLMDIRFSITIFITILSITGIISNVVMLPDKIAVQKNCFLYHLNYSFC